MGKDSETSQEFPLNKGGVRGLLLKYTTSEIESSCKRTQEARNFIRGFAPGTFERQKDEGLSVYETKACWGLYC